MLELSVEVPVRDRTRAIASLRRISAILAPDSQSRLESLLTSCADPDAAIHYLDRLQSVHPEAFLRLTQSPNALQPLLTVFSYSRFLSEEILQHPEWLERLLASGDLSRAYDAGIFRTTLEQKLATGPPLQALSLAEFRREQILRVLLRDVLGYAELSEITEELSALADALLETTYRHICDNLAVRYGVPQVTLPNGVRTECGFSVIGLGKLGGRELNYSSDIDLMFLYSGPGETSGPESITNKEFYKKLANLFTDLLSTYTAEGMCYRVDLRLRPDGRLGEVCISLEGARKYYAERARDWELQMLIKARVCAGCPETGMELLDFVEPRIYSSTLDFSAVEAMSETRERINEKLLGKRRIDELDIKLARGGIRDIEFLVQCLQRLHGGRESWVRHGGTLLALSRLRDKDLLSDSEYSQLAQAYQYLRTLEHRLQFYEDRQTHTLPTDPEELRLLARRMPAADMDEAPSANTVLASWQEHSERVIEIYERVIHAQQPLYYSGALPALLPNPEPPMADATPSNAVRFLDQRAPQLAAALVNGRLRRGYKLFEQLLERVMRLPNWLDRLDANPRLTAHLLDLIEHSPYLSEQLIREPGLLEELETLGRPRPADNGYAAVLASADSPGDLRQFYHREMFRIQAESCCLGTPVFEALGHTSDLADAIIIAAYRLAVSHARLYHPPACIDYLPAGQMMIIALGRLGLREFDLASDADLVFVLPDEDRPEKLFWTRVAERMIEILGTYTKQGAMFSVDTRLRPNGREGALVQSENTYRQYFSEQAAAWEGIAYMKARAIAGNLECADRFLHELQQVDWRRYGQGGRSRKDLKEMRLRLEKELSSNNPLKAGRGGYYDIDFALMYLRLKGAGLFFKVLNTPERIDIVEKMGHLDREDAELMREVAIYYRAVDHGLRVLTGHAEGALPHGEVQLEMLAQLVHRWAPGLAPGVPLKVYLHQLQNRARGFFDRLFQ